jgi:hypothetical protein
MSIYSERRRRKLSVSFSPRRLWPVQSRFEELSNNHFSQYTVINAVNAEHKGELGIMNETLLVKTED